MDFQITINNSVNRPGRYVSWAPSPCTIRMTDPTGVTGPVANVELSNSAASGGQIVFYRSLTTAAANTLKLQVPITGATVRFFIGGRFGRPSVDDGDAGLRAKVGTKTVANIPLMVRIRKNANSLTTAERDRFIGAFARLNNQGLGRFADFRLMHTNQASPQAHGAPGFLPWHRAYLLDLERELQLLDPSVSLHYWRFDRPSPNLFTRDFIGESNANGAVQFSPTNPLQFWRTDGVQGITRRPLFNTATQPANVSSEATTLGMGTDYEDFQQMEFDPHGSAHTSFGGSISSIGTAARSALLLAPLQRRSTLGKVATTQWSIRCNECCVVRHECTRRQSNRPQPARHDVAVEWNHRRSASTDGARWNACCVEHRDCARSAATSARHARLSGFSESSATTRIRLRRRALLTN